MLKANLQAMEAAADRARGIYPGLPVVASHATRRRPRLGATLTDLNQEVGDPVDVFNMPSVKLQSTGDGGVEVKMQLNTRYAEQLPDEPEELKAVVDDIVKQARVMSRGPFTLARLRALGHPYGRDADGPRKTPKGLRHIKGRRGAVPDLTVVNQQSGDLARSWKSEVTRSGRGIRLTVANMAQHAAYVALGTRRMQAHFPLPYLLVKNQSAIRSAWQKQVRKARQEFLKQTAELEAANANTLVAAVSVPRKDGGASA
jgi:hypothetical protein